MNKTRNIVFSGVFLALTLVLPFVTGQIQQIGSMLLPMHLPVLLCGMILGPIYGGAVGFIAPLMRSFIWGMPPFPMIAGPMSFELMAYGVLAGVLMKVCADKKFSTYIALIGAMIGGRIVYGIVAFAFYSALGNPYTLAMFFAGAFTKAVPGIILQLVVIPPIVMAIRKYTTLAYANA